MGLGSRRARQERWGALEVRSEASASRELADCARRFQIAHHDGKRLAIAVLALAEAHDCGFVGCIDAEMEAADAFDGQDFTGCQAGRWFQRQGR